MLAMANTRLQAYGLSQRVNFQWKDCLHRLEEYAELMSQAGFEQVAYQDISQRFIEILQSDIEKIATLDPAKHDLPRLQQSWRQKLARSTAGDHRWGLFTAVKSG